MFPLRRERDAKRQVKFKNPAVGAAVYANAIKDLGSARPAQEGADERSEVRKRASKATPVPPKSRKEKMSDAAKAYDNETDPWGDKKV